MSINIKNQECYSDLLDDSFEFNEDVSRLSIKSINVKQDTKNALVFNKGKVKKSDEFSMKLNINTVDFEENKYFEKLKMKPSKSDIVCPNKESILLVRDQYITIPKRNQYDCKDYDNGTIIMSNRLQSNKKYSTYIGNLAILRTIILRINS